MTRPSHFHESGLIFEFELLRTASSMASSRDVIVVIPRESTWCDRDAPRRLSIEPQNIEELTELRDYKSQVPEKLIALKKVIEEAMRNYQVCDSSATSCRARF